MGAQSSFNIREFCSSSKKIGAVVRGDTPNPKWLTLHNHLTSFTFILILLSSAIVGFMPGASSAQDVVLNPVNIIGQVRITGVPLDQVTMLAESDTFKASQTFSQTSPGSDTINYSLTVDVPPGGSRTYQVRPCFVNMDGGNDRSCFAEAAVTVVDDATPPTDVTKNFIVQPGIIKGAVTVLGGAQTLSYAYLWGYYDLTYTGTNCYEQLHKACFYSYTNSTQNGAYEIAVVPGDIRLNPSVTLSNGATLYPGPIDVTVAAGQTLTLPIEVTPPPGVISGSITFSGPETPNYQSIRTDGPASEIVTAAADGSYELTGLPDGDYYMAAYSYFGSAPPYSVRQIFYHPHTNYLPSRYPTISAGGTVTVDVQSQQAFIEGSARIRGAATFNDVTQIVMRVQGVDTDTVPPTYGFQYGWAYDYGVDPSTGAFRFIVSPGDWYFYWTTIYFTRNGPDLTDLANRFTEYLDIYTNPAGSPIVSPPSLQTVTSDLDLPMGQVTVNFAVADGSLLSNPQLEIGCSRQDGNGTYLASFNGVSRGLGQVDQPTGVASFLAPEGACLVTARAEVNGTLTSFGEPIAVDVVPGADQVIDIGAPTLSIDYPAPNLIVDTDTITVTGTVTDDVQVASVTVNGGATTLTSTGNPADPNEVNFASGSVTLVPGANQIQTIATDTSGKTNTDTRTVYYDLGAPSVDFTPADGLATTDPSALVQGTADDDAGIKSVTVNGTSVSFNPTGNGNEVSFSSNMDLLLGDNAIEVVVTDISDRTTTVTHVVNLSLGNGGDAVVGDTLQMLSDYQLVLEQGTQSALMVDIGNRDSIAHNATLEIVNPNAGLEVTPDLGSPFAINSGAVQPVSLNVDASVAEVGSYDLLLKVTSDDGSAILSNINIIVTQAGAAGKPDLSISSRDLTADPLIPNAGEQVTLMAAIHNKGTAASPGTTVRFYDMDTFLGEATVDGIAPEGIGIASLPVSFATDGVRLIRVVVDPDDLISELEENNNEASRLLQVGATSTGSGHIIVTGSMPSTVVSGQLFTVTGKAFYEIIVNDIALLDYVVKGGSVQFTIQKNVTDGQKWIYGGVHTNIYGEFSQLLQAPIDVGEYKLIISVTDETFTGELELIFNVVDPSTPPPQPPTSFCGGCGGSGGGSGNWDYTPGTPGDGSGGHWSFDWTEPPQVDPNGDAYVYSEDIVFSKNHPAVGEEINIFANIHYWAADSRDVAENIPINIYVINPGVSKTLIGSTVIDRLSVGEPNYGSQLVFTSWRNPTGGIYIIETEIDPSFVDSNILNNAATRAIIVGDIDEGVITGHVLSQSGGVEGVTVELLDLAGTVLKSTHTDSSGGYLLSDLFVGQRQVRIITPAGYTADADIKPAEVVANEITTVDFYLSQQTAPIEQTIFDLYARAKDSKIDIVWTPVAGAEAYNVYRSTTPGGPYTLIAQDYLTDYAVFADFGLTNDVTYYYVVRSITNGVVSLDSNEASATPISGRARRR